MRFFAVLAAAFLCAHAALAQCDAPTHHRRIGDNVEVLESEGTLAFLGHPGLVEIQDMADPSRPTPIGSIPVLGQTTAIEARANLLYIASWDSFDSTGRLTIADIFTPSAPVVLASLTWADQIVDLAASPDRLCVLTAFGQIRILDTTTPAQPVTGTTISSQDFEDLEIRLNVLYATYRDDSVSPTRSRLRCFAVGNITNPNLLTTIDLGNAEGVAPRIHREGLLLATTAADRLALFDLATPGSPALLSTTSGHRLRSTPRLVEVAGSTFCHVFAAQFPAAIWDVTNPASPVRRSFYGASVRAVAPVADAALAFDNDVLASLSFATPTQPQILDLLDFGMPADATYVLPSRSNLILVNNVGFDADVSIIDLADRDRPALRTNFTLDFNADHAAADDRLFAVAQRLANSASFRLYLYDLADPANPVLISDDLQVANSSGFANVEIFIDGAVGVIQLAREFYVLDLIDPSNPRVAAHIPTNSLSDAALDDGLFVLFRTGGTNRFEIYNVADPYSPQVVATINEPDAEGFAFDARTLLVERTTDVAAIYDVSLPSAATLTATIPAPASFSSLQSVHIAGSVALLAAPDRFAFFTLAQASNPVPLGEITVAETPSSAFVFGDTFWTRSFFSSVSAFDLGQLPSVTQHPLSRAVCPGGSFSLSADAQSDSTLSYRWRLNGNLLSNGTLPGGSVVSGAFTRTLTVTNFNPADAGAFSLRFNNACGSIISDNAIIVTGQLPRFLDQPFPVLACPLGPVSFFASTNNLPIATLRWQAEVPANSGTFVDLTDTATAAFSIAGSQTTTLTIAPLPGQRLPSILQTRYRLKATNACGVSNSVPASLTLCPADVNCDGFLDFFDYDDFVAAFESGSPPEVADFNGDGFADFFDFDDFVAAFELGC